MSCQIFSRSKINSHLGLRDLSFESSIQESSFSNSFDWDSSSNYRNCGRCSLRGNKFGVQHDGQYYTRHINIYISRYLVGRQYDVVPTSILGGF